MADVLLNIKVNATTGAITGVAKDFDKLGDSADKTKTKVGGLEKELGSFGSTIAKGFGFGAGFSFGAQAAELLVDGLKAIPQAAMAAAQGLLELAERGSEVAGVAHAFDALAMNAGDSGRAVLEETRKMAQGLVSDMDIMAAANKGYLLGLPITAKEMGVLAQTSISLGQAMRVGPTKAMDDLITGLSRGSAQILDNIGIKVKAADAHAKYARSIGTSTERLSEEQKTLAVYKAAVTAAGDAVEKVGGIQLNAAQHVTQLEVAWTNLRDQVGRAIAESPELNRMLSDIATSVLQITTALGGKQAEVKAFFDVLVRGVRDAVTEFDELRKNPIARALFSGTGLGGLLLAGGAGAGKGSILGGIAGGAAGLGGAFGIPGAGALGSLFAEIRKRAAEIRAEMEREANKPWVGKPQQLPAPWNLGDDAAGNERRKILEQIRHETAMKELRINEDFWKKQVKQADDWGAKLLDRIRGLKEDEVALWDAAAAQIAAIVTADVAARTKHEEVLADLSERNKEIFRRARQVMKDALIDAGQVLVSLGDDTGGWAGATVSAIGFAITAWGNYGSAVTKAQKIQAAATAAAVAFDIYQQNRQNLSAGKATTSGAAQGAAAGSAFGWVGLVAGGIGGALAGFFSGRGFRELAQQAGRTLGIEMTAELAKAIEATKKKFAEHDPQSGRPLFLLSPESASLLNLDKAMASSLKSAQAWAPQVIALIAGIRAGAIPAKEGIEQITKAWEAMAAEAGAAGVTNEMLAIMAAAKAAGTEVKAISDFIAKLATSVAPALAAQFRYLAGSGRGLGLALDVVEEKLKRYEKALRESGVAEDEVRQRLRQRENQLKTTGKVMEDTAKRLSALASLTAAALDAMMQSGMSMIDIFEQLGPTIDAAIAAYQRLGIEIPAVLGNIVILRDFVRENEDLVASVDGLASIVRFAAAGFGDMNDAMLLVISTFTDLENALIARGIPAAQAHALALWMTRDVARAIDDAYRRGLIPTIDDATRAWLEEQRAAGNLDPTAQEQMKQVLDLQLLVLAGIATMFKVVLPAAVQKYIEALNRIPKVPPPPGGGGGGGGGGGENRGTEGGEHMAVGFGYGGAASWRNGPGVLKQDSLFQLHKGEAVWVVPAADTARMGFRSAARGFGADGDPRFDVGGRYFPGRDVVAATPEDSFGDLGSISGIGSFSPAATGRAVRELSGSVADLASEVRTLAARPSVSTQVNSSPTVVVQSTGKTRAGVEAETQTLIPEIKRALRNDQEGLRSTFEEIAETVIRRTR